MPTAADFKGPAIRDAYGHAQRTLRAAMNVGLSTATQATSRQVVDLLEVFSRDVAAAERKAFFERLGNRAQRTIVASYRGHQRGPSGYRAQARGKMQRDAGGKMLGALKPANIFDATPNGIVFLPNPRQLDAEARQWYRLNFGAAPNFGRAPGRFEVSISNVYLFSIGFETGPSAPFRIPRGFWIEGGRAVESGAPGTSEFYPAAAAKSMLGLNRGRTKEEQAANNFFPGRQMASGIKAEHFLDAGLKRFTEDLSDPGRQGIGLRGLYFKFYDRGLTRVRPTRPPVVHVGASLGARARG